MTGGSVDRAVVERRLLHLVDAVRVLRDYEGLTMEELTSTPKTYWAVERGLQLCVQAVLDVAAHLVSALGGTVGDEYRDHIRALSRLGVLPEDFAEQIAAMAGFRNILVHEYIDVDRREVHRVLTQHLDDLIHFGSYVESFMSKEDQK